MDETSSPPATPTVGRIVHYALDLGGARPADTRPAIIVRVWSDTCVQLQVFTDGANDHLRADGGPAAADEPAANVVWRSSVAYDPDGKPGTWRWPPRA